MLNQGATLHGVVCKIFTNEPDDYSSVLSPRFRREPWATTSEMPDRMQSQMQLRHTRVIVT